MQKWEYCATGVYGRIALIFFAPNGLKVEEIKRDKAKGDRNDWDTVQRRIAQLGLEGWELVGVEGVHFYFKRPLPGAEESEG